ncbi:MAG: dihydrofolate reductase [Nocardioidaceae bacterium]|nr:dihydrofolate reductase [Nocardioidaceae bacterium]NUS52790.1 dihydrofolate reductase [Nocardioidaceae bacterium]
MSRVRARQVISIDGYAAGPRQSLEHPFGEGGLRLPQWQLQTDRPGRENDAQVLAESVENVGAYVMGRNMFGPVRGPWSSWDGEWRGWWGEEPPYHAPVFVLTHHEREPLEMDGGTTFHFVTDGLLAALALARDAAATADVCVAGGVSTIRQALSAGVLDELTLHVVPLVLGEGERTFEGLAGLELEPDRVLASPTVTHLRYRFP